MFVFSLFLRDSFRLIACSFILLLVFSENIFAQTAGDYRSKQTGAWNDVNTWLVYTAGAWINASSTPTSSNGAIEIVSGHTVTITTTVTIDQTTVSTGAILELTGGTLNLNNGTGNDLIINGTYIRSSISTTIALGAAQMIVGDGGIYEHNVAGGSIPIITWANGSTLKIRQSITSNLNQTFWNVTQVGASATTLSDDATSRTMIVNNDFRLEGGTFYLKNGGLVGGTHTLRVKGNFIQTGGNFGWNSNSLDNTSITNIYIERNLIISGTGVWDGSVSASQCASGVFFDGNGVDQTFSTIIPHQATRDRFYYKSPGGPSGLHEIYNGTIPQFTVNGSCGTFPPFGYERWPTSGTLIKTFTINNAAGVTLRDNRNIKDTLYRTNGSIIPETVSDIISYSTGATLEYNGSAAITTESVEFPASNGPTNLNINNPGSVNLHTSRSLNGILIFRVDNGLLNTSACNEATTGSAIITLNDGASVTGEGNTRFVNGVITKIGNDAFTFPIGEKQSSTYKYAPIQIATPSNVADAYSACYKGSNPNPTYNTNSKDATLTTPNYDVSTCEYWHFNKAGTSTDVKLTLSWAYGRSCAFKKTDSLVVTNWLTFTTPDQWTNLYNDGNNTSGPGPTQTFGWVTSKDPVANYGTFTLASPTMATSTLNDANIILKGIRIKNADQLNWQLSRACLNAAVYVEQSRDGFIFNKIFQFPVNDLETCQTNMQYAHSNHHSSSTSFYRLKAILTNGNIIYSNTIRLDNRSISLQIYPNPVSSQLRIASMPQQIKALNISNQLGQVIFSEKNIFGSLYMISTETWNRGIYYIRLFLDNGQIENHKIIKQ